MHDNRHRQPRDNCLHTLHGTRRAHIFIRVCVLIYKGVSPLTFARHLGHQYLPQIAEVIPRLLAPQP